MVCLRLHHYGNSEPGLFLRPVLLQLEIDKRKKEKEQEWKADLRSLLHLEALIQLVWDETLNTLFPWQTIGSHKMEENETWSDRKRDKKGEENLFLLAFPLCISFFQQSHEKGWLFFHQSSGVSPFFGQVYLKISLIGYHIKITRQVILSVLRSVSNELK